MVLGDSLSAGYGIDEKKGWVALMQTKINDLALPYKVINASVSGNTTRNGLERLPDLLKTNQPVIVIVALGGNDGLRGTPLTTISKNLKAMIDMIHKNQAQAILVGVHLPPNFGADYTNGFEQIYQDIATESATPYVPSLLNGIEDSEKNFQPDRVHPIENVQPAMLNNVWVVLKPMITGQNHSSPS